MRVYIKWEWRDLWVGVFVGPVVETFERPGYWAYQRTYICLLPCLPIVIERRLKVSA